MNEIELQTDGDLQKISQHKEGLLKALDDLASRNISNGACTY